MLTKLFSFIREYIHILRIGRTISLITYPSAGVFLVQGFSGISNNSITLMTAFLCIGLVIYTGLYSLNTYADYQEDIETSNTKTDFTIISRKQTLIIALVHILIGITLTALLLPKLTAITLALMTVNISYSLFLKKRNRVLAIMAIATTGPLKVSIGLIIANTLNAPIAIFILLHYLFSIAFHISKQQNKGYLTNARWGNIQNIILVIIATISILSVITYENYLLLGITVLGYPMFLLYKKRAVANMFMKY